MKDSRPKVRGRFARAAVALLGTTALAAGGILLTSTPASASTPLVAACANVDPSHVSVSVTGNTGLLGLANIATVTLTNSATGGILGVYPNISLLGGQINLNLATLGLPTGVTDIPGVNYSIAPIPLLDGLIAPITGTTTCIGLPPVTGAYVAVPTTRILDTRTKAKIPANSAITLTVAGNGGVPPMAGLLGLPGTGPSAVNINFTATNAGAPGYLTVYPTGSARPLSSNLNFIAGHDVANTTMAKLGTGGSITLFNGSTAPVDLIGDVSGYYVTGLVTKILPLVPGAYQPLAQQTRLLDTRTTGSKLAFQHTLSLKVAGVAGVPMGAGSVVLNVTSTNATRNGHLRVYPAGTALPFASNVNFTPNRTVANEVVVAPNAAGLVSIFNGGPDGTTDVVVDVIGYIAGGVLPIQTAGLQNAVTPLRLLDTRYPIGTPAIGKILSGGTKVVKVAGVGQVPIGAQDAVITVTATNETSTGFATVYSGATRPNASILNFLTKTDVANVMIAPIAANGTITIYNGAMGPADLVIDISAYITGPTAGIL